MNCYSKEETTVKEAISKTIKW